VRRSFRAQINAILEVRNGYLLVTPQSWVMRVLASRNHRTGGGTIAVYPLTSQPMALLMVNANRRDVLQAVYPGAWRRLMGILVRDSQGCRYRCTQTTLRRKPIRRHRRCRKVSRSRKGLKNTRKTEITTIPPGHGRMASLRGLVRSPSRVR